MSQRNIKLAEMYRVATTFLAFRLLYFRRLRGGEDKIDDKFQQVLSKVNHLSSNIQNVKDFCYQYADQVGELNNNIDNGLYKSNKVKSRASESMKCQCSGISLSKCVESNKFVSVPPRCTARSSKKENKLCFKNPCMDGPFSDVLARNFLPGNKGKIMPAIVGYKSDGIPIYGPPGAAYNVMAWRDGSPVYGRGGPGGKDQVANVRAYNKSAPQYEPTDRNEKLKITLIGTHDNQPITGHKDLAYGMVYLGKSDNGLSKYHIPSTRAKSVIHPNPSQAPTINVHLSKADIDAPGSFSKPIVSAKKPVVMRSVSKPTVNESVSKPISENAEKPLESGNKPIGGQNMNKPIRGTGINKPGPSITVIHREKMPITSGPCQMIRYPLSYDVGNTRCNKYHSKCINEQVAQPCVAPVKFKPGEILKSVAKTIEKHRKRLGLKNPERLLKDLCRRKTNK